ncbi:MAG: chloride channel protein [Bacteroidales bacterium]|nr:chloride channel protein [Bacteroidales bacterium]
MGWPLVLVAGGVMLVKAFACSAANSGGGVAGDFAPTLFAGCIVGFFMAGALNLAFHLDLPVSIFAFCGMAGVMAGTIRAPFMALFLTAEMTGGFNLFFPLLIVSAISYCIVIIFKGPVYYRTI